MAERLTPFEAGQRRAAGLPPITDPALVRRLAAITRAAVASASSVTGESSHRHPSTTGDALGATEPDAVDGSRSPVGTLPAAADAPARNTGRPRRRSTHATNNAPDPSAA